MRHDLLTNPLKGILHDIREEVVAIARRAADHSLPTTKTSESLYRSDPSEGFDCSSFVTWVLREAFGAHSLAFDEREYRHTNDYVDRFGLLVQWPARQPGDIIAFSYNGYRPSHVGIIISEDQYVHASPKRHDHVTVAPYEQAAVQSKTGQEQIYFENPIAIKRLSIRVNDWMLL